MVRDFSLFNYQLAAFEAVVKEYEHGGSSALVLMPTGSGKTVIGIKVLDYLIDRHNIKNIAHVSAMKAISIQANQIFESKLESKEYSIVTYTYSELIEAITNNDVNKDRFDIIIFDEFDVTNPDVSLYEKALTYFNCFKVVFGQIMHSELAKKFKLVYRYSYEQSIQDGSFLNIQKELKDQNIVHLDDMIKNIREDELFSAEIKRSLQNEVNNLKQENLGFQKALAKFLNGTLKKEELLEMSHRVEQLIVFEDMLKDVEGKISERDWQEFFEENKWIFGLGLNYIFNAPLNGKKLETTVVGTSVLGSGKRADALLRTTGIIQSLSFGEIKTHRTNVLKRVSAPYRADSWAISDEFAGGIAQVQRTVQKSLMNISEQLIINDDEGYRQQDPIYLYKPKAFLVIGSLEEFKNEKGFINESKFSSFELFRRSISDIEIITFDELYSRACALSSKQPKWL
jgi:hypothetical protein